MDVKTANSRSPLADTIILLPAFNEAEVIGDVIGEIRDVCDCLILVIDDASTDNTVTVAESAGAIVIPLAVQLGAWGAIQTGLRYALQNNFQMAITMDADGQHEAESLEYVTRPVTEGTADVAIGACTERGSLLRKVAWILMKQTSGLRLEDITSGFRVYNRQSMVVLSGWRATLLDYQDIGVLLLLQANGFQIADIKIKMQARRNGKSRVFHSWTMVGYYICQMLLLGLTKRSRAHKYRPTHTQ